MLKQPKLPAGASAAFAEGWRARDRGLPRHNPYTPLATRVRTEDQDEGDEREWSAGFDARSDADVGVDKLWPKHPDGRPMKMGEMPREQQMEFARAAGRKLQAEADDPTSTFHRTMKAILEGPIIPRTKQ